MSARIAASSSVTGFRDELHAGRHIDQRSIVANAYGNIGATRTAVFEEPLD